MAERGKKSGPHRLGVLLVVSSAVIYSFTGVLTKMIQSDAWTIVCWRGLVGAVIIALYVKLRETNRFSSAVRSLGWRGWTLATVGSLASLCFIAAFKLTYVANVAIIYATAPFIAAALERAILGARARLETMVAAGVALFGVGFMVSSGIGTGHLIGDALALLMTLGMALYMVLIRLFRETPVVLAGAASAPQLFVLGWFVTSPLAVSRNDALLLLLFGVSFALAVVLWTEGTRRIPAAESGLLGSLETPLAILFAWLILAELPPEASFFGGAIVLIAVFGHVAQDMIRSSARCRPVVSSCPKSD